MASSNKEWTVVGLMSGTSLDGLDIAVCRFKKENKSWSYTIVAASTISYKASFKKQLENLMKSDAYTFASMDAEFGRYSGEQVNKFLKKIKIPLDVIASHGHTIFHQPKKGFTTQIGNGAYIAAHSGMPVVSDFRSMDVALGGQGAPLVPIGDKLLFGAYDYCLNLGGIANISFDKNKKRIAGDICPVNIVLNRLANEKGLNYDKGGRLASRGVVNEKMFAELNRLNFYKKKFPKSLGREWVDEAVFPLINKYPISVENKLATYCEHIAYQIGLIAISNKKATLLITGGGAFNSYLIERIEALSGKKIQVVVPDENTISFKEALIFSFLGLLRFLGEENCLKSVTGSKCNSIGGALHLPPKNYR